MGLHGRWSCELCMRDIVVAFEIVGSWCFGKISNRRESTL